MELFDVLILSEYEPAKKIRSGVTTEEFKVLDKEWDHIKNAGKMLCLVPHHEGGLTMMVLLSLPIQVRVVQVQQRSSFIAQVN